MPGWDGVCRNRVRASEPARWPGSWMPRLRAGGAGPDRLVRYPWWVLVTALDSWIMAERHGGPDPAVIALHGWGRTRRDWEAVLADQDGLAVDLPGFGATSAPPSAWTTAEYAEALLPLLSPDSPKILVGHSFGGRIAVHMAAMAPQSVQRLILTGVPLLRTAQSNGSREPLAFRVAKALHRRGLISPGAMETYRRRYGSADYRAATGVMREILVKAVNEDYADQLRLLGAAGVPTTLVWGELDTAAPLPVAGQALALIGGSAELTVVPGAGHQLPGGITDELRKAITKAASTPA